MPERTLPTEADTVGLGRELARGLAAGDLVVLDGPLGAGKTRLVQGIGAGLGVLGRVTSPTFVLAREHAPGPGGVGMVHVDAYRLGGADLLGELDGLDLDTDLTHAVVVVEWGHGVVERLAERHLLVELRREPGTDVRTARWSWLPSGA
ncbi:tRNA (adenosine(37)-N6)-threonylcarbamoyltransferase complex ATPase subunit type 1 TsaE [Rhodococcus aerolatus]